MTCASEWNRPSGSRALVPLPSAVPVTRLPTSRRWTWFPPEARLHTGCLCSAGSGHHPVPRRRRSYAALRLPRLRRPWLRFPLHTAYLDAGACSWPAAPAPADARHVGDGLPALRITGCCRGEARASQVPGPSSSCVPWSNTPPDTILSSPANGEAVVAFRSNRTLGIRDDIDFEAANPTAHTLACLRFASLVAETVTRLATGSGGLTLGRTGFAPAGRPTKFHGVIATSNSLRPAGPGRTLLPMRYAGQARARGRRPAGRKPEGEATREPPGVAPQCRKTQFRDH